MSKGKYRVHYTVDSTLVRSMSGTVTVKANDADKAREKAIVKLARSYADITNIRLHEVYKAKVDGVEPEDAPEEDEDYAPVPDCRCGADFSRGIDHARWCENREED